MIAGSADWGVGNLAAFTAYFDGSGADDQPCVAVAGFVATAGMWVDFEKQWLEALAEFGLPYFHAKELNHDPAWRDDPKRKANLYSRLIQVIRDNVNRQFGCCITLRALPKETQREFRINAYSIAGRACASQVRAWCRMERMATLPEIIFEFGDTGQDKLRNLMVNDGFCEPLFKPKRDRMTKSGFLEKGLVPLQAADLLAFECFDPIRKIEQDGHLKRLRPTIQEFDKILGFPRHIGLKNMEHMLLFNTMKQDELWLPNGPDDMPVAGLN